MQRHAERLRNLRVEPHGRSRQADALGIIGNERLQLVLRKFAEIDALRGIGNHQICRASKAGDALAEGVGKVGAGFPPVAATG